MAIGNPVSTTSSSVASKTSSVIATAGQTLFTVSGGYVTNHISVFRNGIRLVDSRDYEARNGATVTLLAAATVGDVIEFHVFDTFSVADAVTNQGGTIFGDLTVEGSIGNITGVAATFTGAVSVGGVLTYEDVTNVDSIGIMTARSGLNVTGGSLGVGLNNPTSYGNFADDFVIYNASQPGMTLASGSTSGYGSIYFADGTSGNTVSRGQIQYSHSNDFMQFSTAATERLRITSAGDMGLGTNSPNFSSFGSNTGGIEISDVNTNNALLVQSGSNEFYFANTSSANYIWGDDNVPISIATNDTERLRITSDGKIGINQSTPQTTFHSTGTTNGQQATFGIDDSGLKISTFQKTDNDAGVILDAQKSSNGTLTFATTGTERLRITSGGAVTIGTNAPPASAQLTVRAANAEISAYSSAGGSSKLSLGDTNDHDDGSIRYVNGSGYQYMMLSTAASERVRIDSSGRLLVGTTTPGDAAADNLTLHSSGDTGITIRASETDSSSIYFADGAGGTNVYTGAIIYDHATNHMSLHTNSGAERMRIDSSGKVLINHTADTAGGGYASILQVCDTSYQGSSISLRRDGGTGGPALVFGKSRSSSKGGVDIVASGDNLGSVTFYGADGTDVGTSAATIRAEVDGTPGSNDMPGRIIFATTADGASSTTERVRIDSSGHLQIGATTSDSFRLKVLNGAGTLARFTDGTSQTLDIRQASGGIELQNPNNGFISFKGSSSERARFDSSGRLLLGTTTEGQQNADNLTIADSGHCGLTIRSGTTSGGAIYFSDATSGGGEYDGYIEYNHPSRFMRFGAAQDEAMRINSSGDLYIGGTSGLLGKVSVLTAGTSDTSLHLATTGGSGDNGQATNAIRFTGGTNSRWANAKYEAFAHIFHGNGVEKVRINSSGDVSIGRSAGNARLDVYGTITTTLGNSNLLNVGSGNAAGYYHTIGIGPTINSATIAPSAIGYLTEQSTGGTYGHLVFATRSVTTDTAPSERMRITSGGNIQITYPDNSTGLRNKISFVSESPHLDETAYIAANRTAVSGAPSDLVFATGSVGSVSERMRINSSGNIVFNYTNVLGVGKLSLGFYGQTENGIVIQNTWSGNATYLQFRNSSSTTVGSITATTSATSYNTSSDYRLKENVVDITNGITLVKQLSPKRFNFIADPETTVDGFLAHEAQTVVPEAVTGEKDGEKMQVIDQSKLVPLLTAALQEAIAKIETLETANADLVARVTALEG